jgi:hypothetical protein
MPTVPEFFRPEHLRPVDADGFELPPWENPYFAIPDDDQVEPVDAPTAADVEWLNANPLPAIAGGSPGPFVPTTADWADYHAFCREVDQRDELARMERLEDEYRRFGGAS